MPCFSELFITYRVKSVGKTAKKYLISTLVNISRREVVMKKFEPKCAYLTVRRKWMQIKCVYILFSRSQRPRGLRHETSTLTRTLGSWVRIPHKAWMFAFILCR
jgi:hypothetical protein